MRDIKKVLTGRHSMILFDRVDLPDPGKPTSNSMRLDMLGDVIQTKEKKIKKKRKI